MIKAQLIKCQKNKKGVHCYLRGSHVVPCMILEVHDLYLLGRNPQHDQIVILIDEIIALGFD